MASFGHMMIDIETMGTRPNAPIISIGACFFNPSTGAIGKKFYRSIDLSICYKAQGGKSQVWANGPGFDIVILEYAFHRAVGEGAPWGFWNVRCVRTIVELAKGKCERPSVHTGVAHNALDDAIFQAKYVSEMWQALRQPPVSPALDDDLSI